MRRPNLNIDESVMQRSDELHANYTIKEYLHLKVNCTVMVRIM